MAAPSSGIDDHTSEPRAEVLTVAHVIHSLGAGGAEAVLVELARAASSAHLRLIVIGLSDAYSGSDVDCRAVSQLREAGATVKELHAGRYNPTTTLALARILRDERVDIVHTHLKHADVVGGLAALMARVPSVSTLHVIDIPTSRLHRIRVWAAVFARRRLSTTVIALSNEQRRWYGRYAGRGASVTVLPNGVMDPEVTRDRASVRAEIGVPSHAMLALCVSLMRPEKGHSELVEAIRQLPADLPLVIAMAGDGPLIGDIRTLVESDPKLQERTRVLGFRRDTADLNAACDFVIQPSLEDALPTALIAALAAARPIVATDVGGIPDIVGADCGVLVEAGNPATLSSAIVDMATLVGSRPDALNAIQRAARSRYEDRFSASVWVRSLRRVYEQAIGGHASRPRRIALVEFPPSGGLFQFSLQLGEALARAGDEVELITGPRPELASREPGCRIRTLLPTWHPTAGGDVSGWWRRMRRGVRAVQHTAAWGVLLLHLGTSRPDVVMWSEWRFPTDGWAVHLARKLLPNAVLALLAHEPRVLVEQPGADGMYKDSKTTDRALGTAFADLDVVFVLGDSARQVVLDTWQTTAEVNVVPHGDEGILASASVQDAHTTGPVALSFGTITAYKGIDTLLVAWPLVRVQVPDAELVIAGALSADVDESALRRSANLPGVSLHIGYVPVAEVLPYFDRARCVVLPYKRSSQSGVAHLAHTLHRPVVATRVGDIATAVHDGVSGLLVAPNDPDALAGALTALLTDPEAATRLGEAGAAALAAGASWDQVAAKVRQGLASGNPRRQR